MEKKNDGTLLLLLAAGFGIYWLTRKKTAANILPVVPPIDTHPPKDSTPDIDPVDDFDKHKFVQDPLQDNYPVIEQPIYVKQDTVVNTEIRPINNINDWLQNSYVVQDTVVNTEIRPINNISDWLQNSYVVQDTVVNTEIRPITDMLNKISQPSYDFVGIKEPVYNEQTQYNNNTTVTDMFNSVWLPNYDNKTVIDPVLNENLLPIE